jgi:hypothetical protein
MPAIPLPVGLEEKLDAVATEVRRLRVLRGVSWFAVLLFVVPVAAVSVDAAVNLSGIARGLALAGWVAVTALGFWWLVLRRMRGDIPLAELAAAIEQQYPNLAERLRTLVELSEHADAGNGSKGMVHLLARETEKRAKKMNFLAAAPTGFSLRVAAAAVLLGLLAVAPLFVVPGAGERVRRLLLPWYHPPVDVPYVVRVSSGSPVVKRGEAVTLSAFLERTKPAGDLPAAASLVVRPPGGAEEKRLPMSGDDKAAFTVTRPNVTADFEYKVECGPVASDWFIVSAVDPVELADGSQVTITPPGYASPPLAVQKRDGVGEVDALQHSTAALEFRLTRGPSDAHLEFRPTDAKADAAAVNLTPRLAFAGDRRTVSCAVPLTADGTLKLTLFGDKGVRTEVPVAVRAVPDAPPQFARPPASLDGVREVTPDAVLPFDLAITDDVAVGKAFVDFAPRDNPPDRFDSEPLKLPTGDKLSEGKVSFSLAGRAKAGDTVRVRIRVQDTRSLPELGLTPNERTFPESGWAVLKVVETARPLAEQDVLAQKEKAADKLAEAAKKVRLAAEEVPQLARRMAGKKTEPVQAAEVAVNRERANRAAQLLKEMARDADAQPDLRPLADAARDLVDGPLATAEDELRKVETEPEPKSRDAAFGKADLALQDALARLTKLQKANEDGANARLDKAKLDQLAAEQQKLAEDAAKATDPKQLSELERKQKELQERLKKLLEGSEPLKKAQADAAKKRADELAEELKNLADRQRELDEAANRSTDAAKREQLDELNKLQKQLNDKAGELARKTDAPARLSDAKPLDRQPFDRAADQLDRKNAVDAMTEQEKAARDLERLADALADRVKDRGDAKAAAGQIARWQHDLNRRSADAARQNPTGLPKADADKLAAEQTAIRKATERLQLPKSDQLEQAREEALAKTGTAADARQRNPAKADAAGRAAAAALDDLAQQIPSNKDRQAAAKREVDRLRREQEQIQKEAEEVTKAVKQYPDDRQTRDELSKKLAENAAKQDELAKKVKGLDTPGLENRRDRTAAAGERAAEDMKGGLPQDVPSSQADAKRQLDRLRDALDGKTPADEKAAELARLQNELTRNLDKVQKPDELQRLQRQQQDLADQLAKLPAPEAAAQLADAQAAAKAAERAAAKPEPDVDELKKKSKDAAEKLDKLADRMSGEESPEKRLERLARNRQAEADKAKAAENELSDLNRKREAEKQVERDLNDLGDTRTGNAQAAKKKLHDALDRLAKAEEPDKAKDLQQQAADAARRLADAVKKNGDRKDGDKLAQNPNPDPADTADPANALPTEQDVQKARDLAKQQRELRNDVAKAQERAAKGQPNQPKPNGEDPLGERAQEQDDLAKQAGELADRAKDKGDPAGDAAAGAAKAAKQAADAAKAGDPAAAQKAGADAAQKLRDAAKAAQNPDVQKKADDLAKRQGDLSQKMEPADNAAATARQQKRQGELADDAKKLADKLGQAAKEAQQNDPDGKAGQNLGAAADAAKKAAEQMGQAERNAKNGKPGDATAARRQAERNLDDAARAARKDGQGDGKGDQKADGQPAGGDGKPQPGEGNADAAKQAAADAAKQAGDQMKQAQGQMGKGDGKGAAQAGQKAADQLKQAADQMAKAGQGDGQPGQGQGQGNQPGQGGGGLGGDVPSVVLENLGKSWGELPGEVKTKITAELKAKYGEDYARVIKLYFEQLAERK